MRIVEVTDTEGRLLYHAAHTDVTADKAMMDCFNAGLPWVFHDTSYRITSITADWTGPIPRVRVRVDHNITLADEPTGAGSLQDVQRALGEG
jgi:hypothetical protein